MNEQKNLFLAIGLSIAIIVIFQFLMPSTQPIQKSNIENNEIIQPATSIDEQTSTSVNIIKPKEEILNNNQREFIETPVLKGSINLKGAILDDLELSNYKISLDENSKNIDLFLPDGTSNPYYVEIGWKQINETSIDLPNLETEWESNSTTLSSNSNVVLSWKNNQNITFKDASGTIPCSHKTSTAAISTLSHVLNLFSSDHNSFISWV